MLSSILLLSSLLAAASADLPPFLYSVDINQQGNASTFSCLHSNQYGVVFVRVYKADEGGHLDSYAIENVQKAYNAKLSVEVYVTLNATSRKAAADQVDEALYALRNGGIN
ncbi:hypothetical protein PFISCL1PPCAC_11718, partial [Pristionchus fissidentatus]